MSWGFALLMSDLLLVDFELQSGGSASLLYLLIFLPANSWNAKMP